MIRKSIEITLLRVTSNSRYIEFIINCPEGYKFTEFTITVNNDENQMYSIAESLFEEEKTHYVGSVPLSLLGASAGQRNIYTINLKAVNKDDDLDILSARAMISDVGSVYRCLSDDIIRLDSSRDCYNDQIINKVIRNYLVLYAHLEAMIHGNYDEAKLYLDMMSNCFNGCSEQKTSGCNCGK